jgi:pseudouridine kinase
MTDSTKRPRFVCLGGATIDRVYRIAGPAVPGSSNPARGHIGFGGVARNVAENLARLGERVALVSAVGDDADGAALIEHASGLGVEARGVLRVSGARTAEYAAVLDGGGELAIGVADMAILETHLGALAEAAFANLIPGDWLFADCNASADALADVVGRAREAGLPLALDAISLRKAVRLPMDLTGVAALFLNRAEAAVVVGADLDPLTLVAMLRARGAARVVLTLGAEGAIAADAAGLVSHPAEPTVVRDVTGAGDSHLAAMLLGLARGWPLKAALGFGAMVAARTVGREESVDPTLSPALVSAYEQAAGLQPA